MFRAGRDTEPPEAEEHLRQQLSFAKETGSKEPSTLNAIIAKNVLHEDLGRFDSILPDTDLTMTLATD